MPKPSQLPDIDRLSDKELKALVIALLGKVAALEERVAAQAEEIARLKGLKGKPRIKPSQPSGMDRAAEKRADREWRKKRRRGAKTPTAPVEKRVVATPDVPPGSRFKGYESFTVQDLKIEARVVCYRRERRLTPEGRTIVAPLPGGMGDHFGPEIKRFILVQYHQGQTTVPRLVELLRMLGVDISKRQVVRILIARGFAPVTCASVTRRWIAECMPAPPRGSSASTAGRTTSGRTWKCRWVSRRRNPCPGTGRRQSGIIEPLPAPA